MNSQTPPRRRHLIDPADLGKPRPQKDRAAEKASLERVQRWVMSVLIVTTVLHLSAGLVFAAWGLDESRVGARIGLLVIGGLLGVLSVVVGRLIHKKSPITIWLAIGLIPSVVGAVWLFG